MKVPLTITCSVLVPLLAWAADNPADSESYWPQWRGPSGNGVSYTANPPVEWSEQKNLRWKVDIPGKGHASPVVWGDRVFVLTAIAPEEVPGKAEKEEAPEGERRRGPRSLQPSGVMKFAILALSRQDGKVLWQKVLREEQPHEGVHKVATWASSSPVTDGEHIYAFFGSRGLYCLDMDGNLQWEKDLGDMTIRRGFGEGSSPVLHGDRLVINWDHEGQSFIIALDSKTGKELWRVDRDEVTSWATPLIVESQSRIQVITSATGSIRSYDLATGEQIWQSTGMTVNVIPSPVAAGGMVYLTSGFRGNAVQAIRLASAKGDLAGSPAIVWTRDQDTPYTPSPVLYDSVLYLLKHNSGILTAIDASSGEAIYGPQRLPGIEQVFASPVGAGGHLYIASTNGTVTVVKHGREYEILAKNTLQDSFSASPAVAGSELYLRGDESLYCIASTND
jgi:outer membrane protein assembly factor BamB